MVLIPCYCPCPQLNLIAALVLCCCFYFQELKQGCLSWKSAALPTSIWPLLQPHPESLFSLFSSLLPFAKVPPLLNCQPSTACASAGENPDETLSLLKSQLKFSCASIQQRFQPRILRHTVTSCCFLLWPE